MSPCRKKPRIGDESLSRNILNLAMTVLLLLIMNYRFTGNAFHEIGGAALGGVFVFHNVLNRRWYKKFFVGRQNFGRMLLTLVNLVLVVTIVTTFVTGVLISVTVFARLGIRSGSLLLHELHQGAAYTSLILAAIHLGLHWEMLMMKFKNWLRIDGDSFRWRMVSSMVSIVVIAYGIHASFVNHIGSNILMQHVFGGWETASSFWRFIFDYFSIGGCYVLLTYYLMKGWKKIEILLKQNNGFNEDVSK